MSGCSRAGTSRIGLAAGAVEGSKGKTSERNDTSMPRSISCTSSRTPALGMAGLSFAEQALADGVAEAACVHRRYRRRRGESKVFLLDDLGSGGESVEWPNRRCRWAPQCRAGTAARR